MAIQHCIHRPKVHFRKTTSQHLPASSARLSSSRSSSQTYPPGMSCTSNACVRGGETRCKALHRQGEELKRCMR